MFFILLSSPTVCSLSHTHNTPSFVLSPWTEMSGPLPAIHKHGKRGRGFKVRNFFFCFSFITVGFFFLQSCWSLTLKRSLFTSKASTPTSRTDLVVITLSINSPFHKISIKSEIQRKGFMTQINVVFFFHFNECL